ncbi:MAG: fructosamine kinase family protein [Gammaproteobacteria bacterium]
MHWQAIIEQIEAATGRSFHLTSVEGQSGGDINSSYRLSGIGQTFFIKLNRPNLLPMFEAEREGLLELAQTRTVAVPSPIVSGKTAEHSFLALENIEFGSSGQASSRLLGQQLALMHRQIQPFFGWHRDNTIGSTPQINLRSGDWPEFWRDRRLGFQLKLAKDKGYGGRLQRDGERLCGDVDVFFENYHPQPSLLHGDLWAGNSAVNTEGSPVIFDPACYYGDRETDLAMTELFGGYGRDFYAAYQDVWPLDEGYKVRKTLYNLYHMLNHLNLFGGGYLSQAENMISRLLSEL